MGMENEKKFKKFSKKAWLFQDMCYINGIASRKENPIYDESSSSVVPSLLSTTIQEFDTDLTAGSFSGIWHLRNHLENDQQGLFALDGQGLFL